MTRNSRIVGTTLAVALVVGAVASSARLEAIVPLERRNTLTFGGVVSLPGVTLVPGSYIFEVVDLGGGNLDVVRVSSADRRVVYYTGFTRGVNRPRDQRERLITFGEAVNGSPTPIRVWYPIGQSRGREFVYTRKN
jgi:hypothetical protein